MKKTLCLIFAAVGIAMGATEIPVTWEYGSGWFPDGTPSTDSSSISVLLQIDLREMDALGYGPSPIFSWSSENNEYSGEIYVDPMFGELSVSEGYSQTEAELSLPVWGYSPASGYAQSLLGYTFTPGGNITLSLVNVLSDGSFEAMQQWSTPSALPADTEITLGSFYYDRYAATPHKLYDGELTQSEMESALKAIVDPSSPSVPEPTTATLSLLALAGLAARRRRR